MRQYGGLVGALIYTLPCVRADAAQAIGLLARALTFPTPELLEDARATLTYLAQTAPLGVTFSSSAPDAGVLRAYSDSDWAVGHSTTGYVITLAGGAIGYASKRQPCIATSSTEAEIIAASTCATEIAYFRGLLAEMGLEQHEPTPLLVDNKGAIELSRDRKSCHRSRHVDRRFFKVRELQFAGVLRVQHVPTADNTADLLTKGLAPDPFFKHTRSLLAGVWAVRELPRGVMTGVREWGPTRVSWRPRAVSMPAARIF